MDVWLPLFYRLINVIDFDLQRTIFQYLRLFNIYNSFLPKGKESYLYIDRKPESGVDFGSYIVSEVVNYLQTEKNAVVPFNSEFISKLMNEIFFEYTDDNELFYEIQIHSSSWANEIVLNMWWEYDLFDYVMNFDKYNNILENYCNGLYTMQVLQKFNFELKVGASWQHLHLRFFKKIN